MMLESNFIEIADIPLHSGSIPDAIGLISNEIVEQPPYNRCISATGAHGVVYAQKHAEFKHLLKSFYANLPDGMPGVWVGKMKGAKNMRRCYGPDFFEAFMKTSSETRINHFLCGGNEGVAEKLKRACEQKFNNHNIVGTYCPPFLDVDQYDYQAIADMINESNADVVWVGISTPKQEQFAHFLSKHTDVHFLITVGAAFDFHIGNVRQAPNFLQNMGMEWMFRLMMEPKRLHRRYMEIVPLFLYYSARDLWKSKFNKENSK